MSDDCKEPREVNTAADEVTGQPSQRRRRLVKGALAAPVFLTLQNGAIAANSSNDLTVATQADTINSPGDCVFSGPGDPGFEDGTNKADFGESAVCLDATAETGPDKLGRLRCNVGDQTEFQGGYIVTASSATSFAGCA